tara:strand:+ start:474 stop:680 length:207 start_codon:yes stop_codon:yes gene_type:complete
VQKNLLTILLAVIALLLLLLLWLNRYTYIPRSEASPLRVDNFTGIVCPLVLEQIGNNPYSYSLKCAEK